MADALIPMADLAGRWGVTPNTVSRRLAFLGIKPIRQGNFRFITPEQLELAQQLQDHVLAGRPMESFPRPQETEGGQVVRQVRQPGPVVPQVEQLAALAAALTPPVDPLRRARGLAEAADAGLILTNEDLSALLGQGVSSWKDGHLAYGYRFDRHQQGRQVLWSVARAVTGRTTGQGTGLATSRSVGFLAAPEPTAAITVQAISLPSF